MIKLKNRIEQLHSVATTTTIKDVCNEALSKIAEYQRFNLDESASIKVERGISELVVKRLQDLNESEAQKFIRSEKLENLGINNEIHAIKESGAHKNPTLLYTFHAIEEAAKNPEWLVIESIMETLKTVSWDPFFKKALDNITENYIANYEDIRVKKALYETEKGSSFLMAGIKNELNAFLNEKTDYNRAKLLETLSKYVFDKNIANLHAVISEGSNDFRIVESSNNVTINKVFTPAFMKNDSVYFTVRNTTFVRNGSDVRPVNEEEASSLPDYFFKLSTIINDPTVSVSENCFKFFSDKNKVVLSKVNENFSITVNGKEIGLENFKSVYMKTNILEKKEKALMEAVDLAVEHWDSICEADFVKTLDSKVYEGRRCDVFNIDGTIHVFRVDRPMNEAHFYGNCNASQIRNMVMEFMSYDLSNTFKGILSEEEAAIKKLQESKAELQTAINYLEERRVKVDILKESAELSGSSELEELSEAISAEINKLKEEYLAIQSKIENGTTLSEGVGFSSGDEVTFGKKKQS
jgi:hypothetical protein